MNPWTSTRLTIAVVTWKAPALLDRCIRSILAHTPRQDFDLIICENEASPGAVHSDADTVIVSRRNIGIEGAIHLALAACRTPLMVRLDDDSHVLDPEWWPTLLEECRQCPPTTGALGRLHPFGIYVDGPPAQGSVSREWVRAQPWYRTEAEPLLHQPSVGVSGGFCVLNVGACQAVGYPSDEYPHYEEDVIMSLQLRMNGWSLANSVLIQERALCSNQLRGRKPLVAVGDAPSRTARTSRRPKWKGAYDR